MRNFCAHIVLLLGISIPGATASQSVDINLNVRHSVGGVSTFDREKYIVLHAGLTDSDWDSDEQRAAFLTDYDVYLGRNNGSLPWNLSQTTEDPDQLGWTDHTSLATRGAQARAKYAKKTTAHELEFRTKNMMIGGQLSMYPNGQTNGLEFAIADYDALGDYFENYLTYFYGTGKTDGETKPAMVEVVNEPFVHASEYQTTRANISQMHSQVAVHIKAAHPDVLVGGYTAAYPQYESNDFGHWDANWKTFIDIAGADMDFFSLHLYDNPNGSTDVLETQYRSGSNIEALLDMIEHYSILTLGEVKPFNISEYGSLAVESGVPYNPANDWVDVRSYSTILMQLLERPNQILQAIPFMILKAEWGRTNGYPYPTRLLYDTDEFDNPFSKDGPWAYTKRIQFFELWKEVNGTRVDTIASDPDVQVDAYVDGTNAFVIVSSLDHTGPQTIDLHVLGGDQAVAEVMVKHTYADDSGMPTLDIYTTNQLSVITLPASSTAVIKYMYTAPITPRAQSVESKYYATEYLKAILAGTPLTFSITNVNISAAYGESVLRLGLGREHGKSLRPSLRINGTAVSVPPDWRGYDQSTRGSYFGVIEIPIPYNLVQSNNTLEIDFDDDGGHVSSVALQVFEFSTDVRNPVQPIPIDSMEINEAIVTLGFTNGPPNGSFALCYKSNLMEPIWTTSQAGLPIGSSGAGVVSQPLATDAGFFQLAKEPRVDVPVYYINVYPESNTIAVGGSCKVIGSIVPANATDPSIQWSSDDPTIASVADGIVTAISAGTATITATSIDRGYVDESKVTVGASTAYIRMENADDYLAPNTFAPGGELKVVCQFDAGSGQMVSAEKNGIKYLLRELGSNWATVATIGIIDDPTVIGLQSGGSTVFIPIPAGTPPTDELPDGNFYHLFILFESNDGTTYNQGVKSLQISAP